MTEKNIDDDEILSQFGKKLAEIRKKKGFSQERLALESNVARSYLSGVERGKRNISLINICLLARTLNVPPSSLLEPFIEDSQLKSDVHPNST